jgi:hypothetical protein
VPDADRTAGDDEILRAAVGLERRAQTGDIDGGNEEVGVFRVHAEELVAHSAADHVGVEPE